MMQDLGQNSTMKKPHQTKTIKQKPMQTKTLLYIFIDTFLLISYRHISINKLYFDKNNLKIFVGGNNIFLYEVQKYSLKFTI